MREYAARVAESLTSTSTSTSTSTTNHATAAATAVSIAKNFSSPHIVTTASPLSASSSTTATPRLALPSAAASRLLSSMAILPDYTHLWPKLPKGPVNPHKWYKNYGPTAEQYAEYVGTLG